MESRYPNPFCTECLQHVQFLQSDCKSMANPNASLNANTRCYSSACTCAKACADWDVDFVVHKNIEGIPSSNLAASSERFWWFELLGQACHLWRRGCCWFLLRKPSLELRRPSEVRIPHLWLRPIASRLWVCRLWSDRRFQRSSRLPPARML